MGSTGGDTDPARLGELPGESDEAVDACDAYGWYMPEPCASSTGSEGAVEAEEAWCSSCPTGVGDAGGGGGGAKAACGEKASVRSSWMGGKAVVKAGAVPVLVAGAAVDMSVVLAFVAVVWAEGAGGGGGWGSVGGGCLAEGCMGRRFRSMRTEMSRICVGACVYLMSGLRPDGRTKTVQSYMTHK